MTAPFRQDMCQKSFCIKIMAAVTEILTGFDIIIIEDKDRKRLHCSLFLVLSELYKGGYV